MTTKTPTQRARKRPAKKAARKKPAVKRVDARLLVPIEPGDWPPNLTDKEAAKLFSEVEEGLTIKLAARMAGLRAPSVYQWRRRYPKFAERLAEAEEIGHDMMLDELVEISDTAHCRDSAAGAKERREARMEHLRGKAPSRFHRSPFRSGDLGGTEGVLVGVVLVPARDPAPKAAAIEGQARRIEGEAKPRAGTFRLGSQS